MECTNGKTEKITGGLNSSHSHDQRERLGSVQTSGGINGIEQVGFDTKNSSRENTFRSTSQSGATDDGKILERLEFIEHAYLNYVHSHQQRLETRLIESKEQEDVFKEAIQALKREILNLASNNNK